MTFCVDLLAMAGAQYMELNGVKGVFIPEVPNFKYKPGESFRRGANPPRAMLSMAMFKTHRASQKYDWMGKQMIPPDYQDEYLSNPDMVSRSRYCAYGYNWKTGVDDRQSMAQELERLLED